jgi:hypothetical protein
MAGNFIRAKRVFHIIVNKVQRTPKADVRCTSISARRHYLSTIGR